MGKEVFSRYEKKYIITQNQYEPLVQELSERIPLDSYSETNGFYSIHTIYYDTADDYLIKRSLSKPVYKDKLRLRAYGTPGADGFAYLELKKKFSGKTFKRRTLIGLEGVDQFVQLHSEPKTLHTSNFQVLEEIKFFTHRFTLMPKVSISYDRLAFAKGDLRITFDTNIRTRRDDLHLEAGGYGQPLRITAEWLMEIKVNNVMPLWLTQTLSRLQVFSTSFSKYGTEFVQQYSLAACNDRIPIDPSLQVPKGA